MAANNPVGMMKPNWFDNEFDTKLDKATAEQALAEVAKSPRILKAVADALAEHDKHPGRPGPSRTQAIRGAIAEALQAD